MYIVQRRLTWLMKYLKLMDPLVWKRPHVVHQKKALFIIVLFGCVTADQRVSKVLTMSLLAAVAGQMCPIHGCL